MLGSRTNIMARFNFAEWHVANDQRRGRSWKETD